MNTTAIDGILDENPAFKRTVYEFMALLDAASVLERHLAPQHEVASAYLREVGLTLMRDAGLPEDFIQACVQHHHGP